MVPVNIGMIGGTVLHFEHPLLSIHYSPCIGHPDAFRKSIFEGKSPAVISNVFQKFAKAL